MARGHDTTHQEYLDNWRSIVLGRVFTHDDAMHFVLEVDDDTGLCRVSRRSGNRTEIVEMPIADVVLHVRGEVQGAD